MSDVCLCVGRMGKMRTKRKEYELDPIRTDVSRIRRGRYAIEAADSRSI